MDCNWFRIDEKSNPPPVVAAGTVPPIDPVKPGTFSAKCCTEFCKDNIFLKLLGFIMVLIVSGFDIICAI